MKIKMEQSSATNPNPVLSAGKDGIVLYSNIAGEPLLHEWGVVVGEKLPAYIGDFVQRVISRNSPEKIEVKAGNSIYSVAFHPLPEEKCVNIYGFDISDQKDEIQSLRARLEEPEELQRAIREGDLDALVMPGSEEDLMVFTLNGADSAYRILIETANEDVVIVDAEFKITYAGKRLINKIGCSQEEVIGRSWLDFVDEESKAYSDLRMEKRRQGSDENYELKLIRQDGSPLWILASSKPLFDENGKFKGALAMLADITERKQAVKALRAERNFSNAVLDTAGALVCVLDLEGRIVRFNKACEKKTGYTCAEVMGRVFWDFLLTENEKPGAVEGFKWLKAGQFPLDYENHWVARNSELVLISWSNTAILDQDGAVEYIIATGMDITERKQAEDALQESEEKYRTFFDNSIDAILLTSPDGAIYAANPEACRIFGMTEEEIIRAGRSGVVDRSDPKLQSALGERSRIGKFKGELNYRRKDGTIFPGEVSTAIFTDRHSLVKTSMIIRDITERKKAEEALKNAHDLLEERIKERTAELEKTYNSLIESEEKYRSIVETTYEGILVIDAELRITYVNKRMMEMLGYCQEELIGRPWCDFFDEEGKAVAELNMKKRQQGINETHEFRLMCKDGSHFWALVSSKALLDKDGKFAGSLSMHYDITERKKAQEALEKIDKMRIKEIHHRIKNNLQVISSMLDLQSEIFEDKKVKEAFKEGQDRVISMALIHEELYKGEGTDTDTLDFSAYLQKLARNLFQTYNLSSKNIRLCTDLEEKTFLDMDTAVPLGIIVNELVSNSLKHAFPGRDRGEISIKLQKDESEDCKSTSFILTVSDNGIGIPENLEIEDLDSLGMQLVTTLVDQLDGELELKRNNGTEFTMKFAVIENNNQATAPALQQSI